MVNPFCPLFPADIKDVAVVVATEAAQRWGPKVLTNAPH